MGDSGLCFGSGVQCVVDLVAEGKCAAASLVCSQRLMCWFRRGNISI